MYVLFHLVQCNSTNVRTQIWSFLFRNRAITSTPRFFRSVTVWQLNIFDSVLWAHLLNNDSAQLTIDLFYNKWKCLALLRLSLLLPLSFAQLSLLLFYPNHKYTQNSKLQRIFNFPQTIPQYKLPSVHCGMSGWILFLVHWIDTLFYLHFLIELYST